MLEFSFLFLLLSDGNQIKTEPTDIVRYETVAAPSQNFFIGKEGSVYFISISEAIRDNSRGTGQTPFRVKTKH